MRWVLLMALVGCLVPRVWSEEQVPATITSDELELQNNGAVSVFTGHVVLVRTPYRLEADQMVQTKATQIVEASGHVRGTWVNPSGEKILATGRHARYNPTDQVSELWGEPMITRWETAGDTAPVFMTADRFVSEQRKQMIWAKENFHAWQEHRMEVRSDMAQYIQADQTIHLWGPQRVKTHVEDVKGKADFVSDRGWVCLKPKEAKFLDRVRGHMVPAPGS